MASATDQFRDEGWAVFDELFTSADCDEIVAAAERRTYPRMTPELLAWATDPRWALPVLGLLGPDVRFFREQLVTKYPHSSGTVPWHQDHGYAPMRPATFLTCFLALEDITEDNGCLWVVAGSHRGGPLDHVPAGAILRVDAEVGDEARPVPLAKGSLLTFSSLTFHHSGPNLTDSYRQAWIVQFCVADAVDGRTDQAYSGCPVVAEHGAWRPSRIARTSPGVAPRSG
jgi:phytanoyl-CoA hydroxylase